MACHRRHVRDPETSERISARQADILTHLDEREPVGLIDLAKHLGVTPGTMSASVDRLVEMGYVIRERGKEDRRRVGLRLTASGVRIRSRESVLEPDLVLEMVARLTETERREAVHGLELLARAAREMQHADSESRYWNRRGRASRSIEP
jgi:DNA-binding MarR family transcriptional regulator